MATLEIIPPPIARAPTPEETADRYLQAYWDRLFPVNPVLIARKAGASVSNSSTMDFSGSFEVVDGRPSILHNSRDPLTRQRFTIAHELGHFALEHGDRLRDQSVVYGKRNYDVKEVEANRFAAQLIMPGPYVYHEAKKWNSSFEGLAEMFGVSEDAMRIRLNVLGIF